MATKELELLHGCQIKSDYITLYSNDTMLIKGMISPSNDGLRKCGVDRKTL